MDLYWQEPELQLLTALLSRTPDKAVIDVGAERGAFAEELLRVGGGAVHVVEPEPSNAEFLRTRFRQDPRVVVHEYAIGEADTPLELHRSRLPSGEPLTYGHTVLVRPDTDEIAWGETIPVAGRSLASLVAAGELPARVGILKIDTEGNDLAVVSGMGPLQCDVVMVEHWTELPHSLGPCPWDADEMLSALRARGFSHFVLVVHRGEVAFFKWDSSDIPRGEFGNLVFLHERIVEDVWPLIVDCAAVSAESAIAHLEKRLNEVEADRQLRLEAIERLDAALKATSWGAAG
jgi:FkbM family methyltransferase